jgi:hypothetical protein
MATTRELLDRIEKADAEVRRLETERAIEAEVERRIAARLEAQKARPRRSQMSAKAISDYLAQHGEAAFLALPR